MDFDKAAGTLLGCDGARVHGGGQERRQQGVLHEDGPEALPGHILEPGPEPGQPIEIG